MLRRIRSTMAILFCLSLPLIGIGCGDDSSGGGDNVCPQLEAKAMECSGDGGVSVSLDDCDPATPAACASCASGSCEDFLGCLVACAS